MLLVTKDHIPPADVTQADPTEEKKQATLSREFSRFLIELSMAVHRYAMYPPDHPSLAPAVENVVGRLSDLFESRPAVSIGVAQRQLVIEGVATDSRHPVLSDLARRLHGHHLGAISFARGTKTREVEEVLQLLASETERGGEPVGLLATELIPSWEHAHVYPIGYDQLEMKSVVGQGEGEGRSSRLWLGLAQAALASDEPQEATASSDPKSIARTIDGHRQEDAYDQVIVGHLLQLADELKSGKGGESEKVRRQVSTLVNELGEETLTRLVEMGGDEAQRRRFLLDANQGLAVGSVVRVLGAAAEGGGQNISNSMTRLLSKLAVHAEHGGERMRVQADTALRENVDELIEGWNLADPNPPQYTAVLDAMARSSPVFQTGVEQTEEQLSGSLRIVQMALEVEGWGPTVRTAVEDLLAMGLASSLIELVDSAGTENKVRQELQRHLIQPSLLQQVLAATDVDQKALEVLITGMGSEAILPLMEVLSDSDSRSVRRKVFDHLVGMGPEVAERAVEGLADGRWFVQRNMLALLQRLETMPEGFDPISFLDHADQRVRRESIPLALRKGGARERVVAAALADEDERTVRMGLLELQEDLPETLVPVLVTRVIKSAWSPEIRALGARALGNSTSTLALDVLIGLAIKGRSLLGRPRLGEKTPEVLASLHSLARSWPAEPRARAALAVAARSKDPEMRRAAMTEGSTR